MRIFRILTLVCALCIVVSALMARAVQAAQAGASDMAGGYGWQVLEKVLPLWQPPMSVASPVIVSVRVGSNGEVLYCDTRSSSGNDRVDLAACSTVSKAGPFAAPPNSIPAEVFLALPGKQASSGTVTRGAVAPGAAAPAGLAGHGVAPSGNYADVVMAKVRPHLKVPADFKGEAVIVVEMHVDGEGRTAGKNIIESSGATPSVNLAVMDAINKAGVMPVPPNPPRQLTLSFTVRGL